MLDLLRQAAKYSISKSKDKRVYLIGAVGIREDGRMVHARNEAILDTETFYVYKRFPESHAEARLTRKLGFGATVYVARTSRRDGTLVMARPCECCRKILKSCRVERVFYTINENEWGVWNPVTNTDILFKKNHV